MRLSTLTRASGRSRRRPGPRKGWPTHKAKVLQKRIRARAGRPAGGSNMIAVYRTAGPPMRTGRRSRRRRRFWSDDRTEDVMSWGVIGKVTNLQERWRVIWSRICKETGRGGLVADMQGVWRKR